jgi:hypothetical protein
MFKWKGKSLYDALMASEECLDICQNDTWQNDTLHNDAPQNDAQQNDALKNATQQRDV